MVVKQSPRQTLADQSGKGVLTTQFFKRTLAPELTSFVTAAYTELECQVEVADACGIDLTQRSTRDAAQRSTTTPFQSANVILPQHLCGFVLIKSKMSICKIYTK